MERTSNGGSLLRQSNEPFQGTAEKLRSSVPYAASPLWRPLNWYVERLLSGAI